MPNDYSGFAALGDIVAGGPKQRAQGNYNTYLKQSADGLSALDKAAIVRAQRIARDNLPAAIAGDPLMAPHADLATSILGAATGQPNLGTYTKGLGDLADQEMDRQALEALQSGDLKRAQQLSAVKTDKILPTLGAGGKAVFTPVTGDVAITPLGDAVIGATGALQDAREASADAAHARAEHSRRPPTAKPSKIQARAESLDADVAILEREIGRPLTAAERADFLQGKPVKTGDTTAPAGSLGNEVPADTSIDVAAPVVMEGYQSFDDVPAEARARLREGVKTTFGNGQVWTLIHGQPTRVK